MAEAESPKETILSIVMENRALRWLSIFGWLGVMVSLVVIYLLATRPSVVWLVTEDGKITNSRGSFFEWEAEMTAKKAMEIYWTMSKERAELLKSYFVKAILERESVKNYMPRDKVVNFNVESITHGSSVKVIGTLLRHDASEEKFEMFLEKVERSAINPYGLIVVDVKPYKEAPMEAPKEGLSAVDSPTSSTDNIRRSTP